MASGGGYVQTALLMLLMLLSLQLLCLGAAEADQDSGTVIPAESRPCVDCHAFEFMQRALQDLKKTAFNLDARQTVRRYNGHSWTTYPGKKKAPGTGNSLTGERV
uniref:NELL2-interacting cell ontogeny regulator 1 n=1 Tax=Cynoglossus semilaevis TaxID=244447 RepID=A0A3P8V1T5_CYNSE